MPRRKSGERPRRPKGAGSIREVRPGYFAGRLTVNRQTFYAAGTDRQRVQEALQEKSRRARLFGAGSPSGERVTFGQQLAAWLETKRGTVEPRSWTNLERAASEYLSALHPIRLGHLTPAHLRGQYARLLDPPWRLSPKTVREAHSAARQALSQAVDDGTVNRNVALLVKPPRGTRRTVAPVQPAQRVLLPAALARFWAVAQHHRLYALFVLAAHVPSRSGELRALTWPDLDEREGTLTIRRSLQRSWDAGRSLYSKAPKTASGVRVVELDPDLLAVLTAHRSRQQAERRQAGGEWVKHDLVFCTRYGTPLLSGNLLTIFRRLLREAGVPAHYRVHDLRHTSVSALLAAGIPAAEVAELAGHASAAVTTAIYAHVVKGARSDALSRLRTFYRAQAEATEGAAQEKDTPA